MKNKIIGLLTFLGLFVSFAGTGNARSDVHTEFEIPFEFTVKSKVFPAGKYLIERLTPNNPNFLVLKQVNGKQKTILLVQNTGGKKFSQDSRLMFNRFENSYSLEGVWAFGEKYGQKFLTEETDLAKGEKFMLIYRHKN